MKTRFSTLLGLGLSGLTLLHIFAPRPAPEGPQCIIRCPIKVKIFSDRWNDVSVPPTRNDKVPAFAPVTPNSKHWYLHDSEFKSTYRQTPVHPPSLLLQG